jgi:hypothetical protein
MNSPFDILKKKPEGSFRWFEALDDLESANIRIEELVVLSPGEYVVFDQRTHNVIPADRSSFRFRRQKGVTARRNGPHR